jgi:hypothetical protein
MQRSYATERRSKKMKIIWNKYYWYGFRIFKRRIYCIWKKETFKLENDIFNLENDINSLENESHFWKMDGEIWKQGMKEGRGRQG